MQASPHYALNFIMLYKTEEILAYDSNNRKTPTILYGITLVIISSKCFIIGPLYVCPQNHLPSRDG